MLKFGNKEFRNLQEQVYANMKDIAKMKEGVYVLDEFGIKVVGEVETLADLPTIQEYKEEHEDWAYGDAYAVGTEAPYALYILTRANSENPDDYWFDIGEFPMPGPQGETGAQGPVGPQGPQGNTGASGTPAGFGTITATAETLVPGSSATATVVASGPDSEKSFAFTFGIPRGQDGEDLDVNWGEIEGTLSDQTDLQDALDDKQDAILNYDSSTANSVTFKDNIILKNESNKTTTIGRGFGLAIATDQTTILNASNDAIIPNLDIRPLRDNAISIGNNISRIKDIKMSGVIGDGTHTFTLPSNTGTLLTNNDLKTINNESIIGSGNIDIQSAVWGNITGTLSSQTDLQNALNAKQDTISDLATIRSGAALGATAVQPSALDDYVTNSDLSDELQDYVTENDLSTVLDDYVTTGTVQTITGDKTFSGKLNKNANGYGLVLPSTSSYIQNKTLATIDQIKDVYQHYITFTASGGKTVIATKLLTQGNTPMLASDFAQYLYDAFADATGGLEATGTIEISSVDHKYVGKLGRGSSNNNITVYPITSNGGYGNAVTLATNIMANFIDVVERVGSHGGGATGGSITGQDVINALGYVPSHVDANPSTTTSTLNSIGIDGINYSLGGSVPSNMVTTDTNQTITGTKYFTKPLHLGEASGLGAVINGGHTPTGTINDLFISVYNQGGSGQASQIYLSSDDAGGGIGFTTRNTSDEMSAKIGMQNTSSDKGYIKIEATDGIAFTTGSDAIGKLRGALIPDTTGWTANKTIATTDQIPTVPTTVSSFTNDAGYITGITSGMVTTALGYTPGTSNFSGSYNDLTNKPTIPVVPTNVSAFTNDAGYITSSALSGYATESWVGQQGYITGITSSDVITALGYTPGTSDFSGDYDDLTNKPSIPTATSDLANDSGFITINDIPVTDVEVNGTSVVSGGLASISVPTVVSDLTNDAGYITSSALSSYPTRSQMNTAISTAISNQTKETWTFEVDDGQGGTTTVTKTIVLG